MGPGHCHRMRWWGEGGGPCLPKTFTLHPHIQYRRGRIHSHTHTPYSFLLYVSFLPYTYLPSFFLIASLLFTQIFRSSPPPFPGNSSERSDIICNFFWSVYLSTVRREIFILFCRKYIVGALGSMSEDPAKLCGFYSFRFRFANCRYCVYIPGFKKFPESFYNSMHTRNVFIIMYLIGQVVKNVFVIMPLIGQSEKNIL